MAPDRLQVFDRLVPDAAFFGVVGQAFDVLIEASRREHLERAGGARMQLQFSFSQQARVCDLARHRVLESIFRLREKRFLEQELGGLQVPHAAAEIGLCDSGHGLQKGMPEIAMPMTAAHCSSSFRSGRRRSIRAASSASMVRGTKSAGSGWTQRHCPEL